MRQGHPLGGPWPGSVPAGSGKHPGKGLSRFLAALWSLGQCLRSGPRLQGPRRREAPAWLRRAGLQRGCHRGTPEPGVGPGAKVPALPESESVEFCRGPSSVCTRPLLHPRGPVTIACARLSPPRPAASTRVPQRLPGLLRPKAGLAVSSPDCSLLVSHSGNSFNCSARDLGVACHSAPCHPEPQLWFSS